VDGHAAKRPGSGACGRRWARYPPATNRLKQRTS
jgi:hypothetical protein